MQTQPQVEIGLGAFRVGGSQPPGQHQVLAQPLLVEQIAHQADRRRHMLRIVTQRRPVVLDHQLLVALARALDRGVIVQVGAAVARRLVIVHQPQVIDGWAAEQRRKVAVQQRLIAQLLDVAEVEVNIRKHLRVAQPLGLVERAAKQALRVDPHVLLQA